MTFKNEFIRLFNMWIAELDIKDDFIQSAVVKAVMVAFLAWYED